MKFARFVSLLAVTLPALAFAASPISVTALSGQARTITDGESSSIQVGSDIAAGSSVETNTGSSAELTLSNGVKLVLSPGTRIRVKSLEIAPGIFSCEIVLLRGSITGNATGVSAASNLSIRTTAGTVGVSGTEFSVGFSPSSLTTGDLTVVSLQGAATVLPVNSVGPVSVPAGSQAVVGASGAQVSPASATTLANAKAAMAGITPTQGDNKNPGPSTVDSGTSTSGNTVNLALISPNGEGQTLLR